jgi:hypothetical protein
MRIYYNMGDRTNALRQYERCATILKEEMDVSPSQRTEKLFEFIKEDKFDPSTNPAVSQIQPAKMGSIYGLVYHLSQLRYHLSEAHQQVGQDIEIVQSILLKDQ